MSIDDLIRQMQEDEDNDRVETQTHATPIEYARARGMAPQKVYYALRNHHDKLTTEQCKCGRRVLDIETADSYFGFKKEVEDGDEEQDAEEVAEEDQDATSYDR